MSGSGKKMGSSEDGAPAITADTSDLLRDISSLNVQVQMISDSLAACKRMSNYRSARRDCNYAVMTQARLKPTPQTPVQVLLPPEERTLVFLPGRKWKSVIVSFMMNGKTNPSYLQKSKRFARREEVLSKSDSGDDVRGVCRSSRSRSLEGASHVDLCAPGKAAKDAAKELDFPNKTNSDLILIFTGLFDTFRHCKGCSRCNKKIGSYISRILSRIQKLVDYVALKKRIRAEDRVGCIPKIEGKEETSEERHFAEVWKRIGRSEQVEAFAVSEDLPGVQILLQVKVVAPEKRLFAKAGSRPAGARIGAYPVLHLAESSTVPVVVIARPRAERESLRSGKLERSKTQGFLALLGRETCRVAGSTAVRILEATTRTAPSCRKEPYDDTRLRARGRPTAVDERSECRISPATEVRDLFSEEFEGKEMQVQRVKELEGEVKGLKDLMMEVHKNQMELSRVLVEKGLRSRDSIALEEPAVPEEESEASRREEAVGRRSSSAEAMQMTVDHLKRTCSAKNRMIVTLLKGLRSDVPKEWWEDLVDYIFDEESDPEKVDEFIRQTSLFLLNGEKGSTVPPPTPRNEDFSSEGKRKGSDASLAESRAEDSSERAAGPLRFSSFVQNILCEDFRTGVTVVELFVAVKTAKDHLDLLSKSKSQAMLRIDELNEEIANLGGKLRTLLENMEDVLSRLDEKVRSRTSKDPTRRPEVCKDAPKAVREGPEKERNETKAKKQESEGAAEESGCSEAGGRGAEGEGGSAAGAEGGKKSTGEEVAVAADLPGSSELPRWPSSVAAELCQEKMENKKSENGVDLTDSAVRMICGICGILAGPQEPRVEESSKPDEPATSEKSVPSSNDDDARTGKKLFCWKCVSRLLNEVREMWPSRGKDSGGEEGATGRKDGEDDAASDSESVFEEALSDPCPVPADPRAKPSVTCMGDLTKAVKEKKSVSTLTATNGAASSWIGQLTEDLKTKIKGLRSTKKVTVGEKPEKSVTSLLSVVELTIIADTPVGVFDVSVKQYQDRRRMSGMSTGPEDIVTTPAASHPAAPFTVSGFETGGHFCSDESLNYSDCVSDNDSDLGENDLEEFLELPKENQEKSSGAVLSSPGEKGSMTAMIKADKPSFFEVLKCEPRQFVEEILPKAVEAAVPKGERKDEDEIAPLRLTGSRYEDLSRLPQRLVIEGSSSDLIIYVQVEMEEAGGNSERTDVYVGADEVGRMAEEGKIPGSNQVMSRAEKTGKPKAEGGQKAKEERLATFCDELLDVVLEKEIRDMFLEEPKMWATAATYVVMESKARMDICLQQILSLEIYEIDQRKEERRKKEQEMKLRTLEMDKVLGLIHEIENDVMEVKLSDAISILPHLELELQKHLRQKMENLGRENDDFFYSDESRPLHESGVDDDSEERLPNLLSLVSGLEKAVRQSECDLCDRNSSRILRLLRALTRSIRELEEELTLGSLAEALDIASELNTAAREVEAGERAAEELPGKKRLKSVRRKVFEVVEKEAVATERRIERDFDRIDHLEMENDEVIMFVQVFLEKTQRRASELEAVKTKLKELSSELYDMSEEFSKGRSEKESAKDRSFLTTPSRDSSPSGREVPVRDTVSGLLSALDSLKLRAKRKSDICRGILGLSEENKELPGKKLEKKPSKISKSSSVSKTIDLASSIKKFKQIGNDSLYLSWTKPEGLLATSVTGFEILVNGKRHQKVRNPNRLQAVLYSVDLIDGTEVQLQAFVENRPKALLATVTYRREK